MRAVAQPSPFSLGSGEDSDLPGSLTTEARIRRGLPFTLALGTNAFYRDCDLSILLDSLSEQLQMLGQ